MSDMRELTLEDLADAAGMTPRNVRAYQSKGLLPPPRRDGRTVLYGPDHVARLRLVKALHHAGLSLRVVRGLIERGVAEEELVRLARDQLLATSARPVLAPMTGAYIDSVEAVRPGTMAELEDAGVVVRRGDRLLASAAILGVASALLARGVDLAVSSRVVLAAASAAQDAVGAVRQELDGLADPDEVAGLLVQLAACAYADVLARRLAVG